MSFSLNSCSVWWFLLYLRKWHIWLDPVPFMRFVQDTLLPNMSRQKTGCAAGTRRYSNNMYVGTSGWPGCTIVRYRVYEQAMMPSLNFTIHKEVFRFINCSLQWKKRNIHVVMYAKFTEQWICAWMYPYIYWYIVQIPGLGHFMLGMVPTHSKQSLHFSCY